MNGIAGVTGDALQSDASNATIAVNQAVIDRLERLKTLTVAVKAGRAVRKVKVVRSASPEDLVFQSLMTGAPMRDNNILTRFIKPAGRKIGLDFVNWRCLRNLPCNVAQAGRCRCERMPRLKMRHSRASTTMDIYQQFVPESQRTAINRFNTLVLPLPVQ